MDVIAQNQVEANDLYETMNQVDRAFSDLFEGGSGVGDLGDVIPFDDAVVFTAMLSGRDAYDSFRDFLEQSAGMTYSQVFDLDRESVADLQRSLPPATVEELFRRAQTAKDAIRTTGQAFATAIRGRLKRITFDYSDGLSPETLVHSWHTLCADHTSLRHLASDLRDAAWPDHQSRWRDLEQAVTDAIIAMRDCFDWDQMTSHRSQGQALPSWPLATDVQEQLEEVRTLLSRAAAMWDSLRATLAGEVDEHFEFYAA